MIYKNPTPKEIYTREKCHITELLNDPGIPNLSLAIARVEPNITTEQHQLEVDEAYYILEGLGIMQIDGKSVGTVERGDVVYIRQGRSQQITNKGSMDLLFLCICTPRFTENLYHPSSNGDPL